MGFFFLLSNIPGLWHLIFYNSVLHKYVKLDPVLILAHADVYIEALLRHKWAHML